MIARCNDWNDISSNVKGILSKAVLYVNSEDFVKAADVGLVILETLAEEYDYSEIDEFQYDEDYEIAKGYGTDYDSGRVSFIKEAAEFVVDAITHWKEDGTIQEQKFKELEQRLRKVSIALSQTSFLDGNRDALDCFNSFSKNNMSTNDYCRLQLSIVDKEGDGETVVELYTFLKEHPECDINAETFAELYNTASRYDAATYHVLVNSIKTLSRVNAKAKARMEELATYLRATFPRRRMLLNILP